MTMTSLSNFLMKCLVLLSFASFETSSQRYHKMRTNARFNKNYWLGLYAKQLGLTPDHRHPKFNDQNVIVEIAQVSENLAYGAGLRQGDHVVGYIKEKSSYKNFYHNEEDYPDIPTDFIFYREVTSSESDSKVSRVDDNVYTKKQVQLKPYFAVIEETGRVYRKIHDLEVDDHIVEIDSSTYKEGDYLRKLQGEGNFMVTIYRPEKKIIKPEIEVQVEPDFYSKLQEGGKFVIKIDRKPDQTPGNTETEIIEPTSFLQQSDSRSRDL